MANGSYSWTPRRRDPGCETTPQRMLPTRATLTDVRSWAPECNFESKLDGERRLVRPSERRLRVLPWYAQNLNDTPPEMVHAPTGKLSDHYSADGEIAAFNLRSAVGRFVEVISP